MAESRLLFTIPNLQAQQVTEQAPWEFSPSVPDSAKQTKVKYREWLAQPSTQHCLYSCVEGAIKGLRVSDTNPIVKVHGLIVDYDTVISDAVLESSLRDCAGEFRPNWVHSTPNSGGRRLIWLFKSPALVADAHMAKLFIAVAAKKLQAKNFLAGICTDSLGNPTTYYDVGSRWQELDAALVPEQFISYWLMEAGAQAHRSTFDGPVIPLEDVQKEIERRFPGRWEGPFQKGAMGPRFWDPSSDNPRACVVNRFGTGMQCFTGGTAFMPWVAIFGAAFCEKYKAETLGRVIEGTWFDGKVYWRKNNEGSWFPWQKEDYKLYLKAHHQLSVSKSSGRVTSELEDTLHSVNTLKTVMGALPYIYLPDGPITVDGERYLNISTAKVLPPAPDAKILAWGEEFPWLAAFLDAFWPDKKPKEIFLGWLQRAYVPAYEQSPLSGQAILLAGDVGRGKSLLGTVILSKILGGSADASEYFLGEEPFSYHILRKPLMTVDDELPSSSSTLKHTRYSAMLKKIVANGEHNFNRKFRDAGKITWLGRVVITCNLDSESIRLLPNMEMSDAEKVNLFRCNQAPVFPFEFPSRPEIIQILDRELPYFCRWLMQWKLPPEYQGRSRFGVVHYHDPLLLDTSLHAGDSFSFMEVLQIFLKTYRSTFPDKDVWEGTASKLISDMSVDEGLKPLVSRLTSISISKYLNQLRSKGFAITQKHTRLERKWTIAVSLADTETSDPVIPVIKAEEKNEKDK